MFCSLKISFKAWPVREWWKDNMILVGLWFGSPKPAMWVYLKPFHSALSRLERDGKVIESPYRPGILNICAILLCGTCDLAANACICSCFPPFPHWSGFKRYPQVHMVVEPQVKWIATINKYIERVLLQSIFAVGISLALFSLLYAGGQKLWQALSFLLLPERVLRFWVVNLFSWKSHHGATEKLFSNMRSFAQEKKSQQAP